MRAVSDPDPDQQQRSDDPLFTSAVGGGQECVLCPVCVLLQALSHSHPDVTGHLVAAGRELTRALTTLLEGHGERSRRSEEPLQRIRVD